MRRQKFFCLHFDCHLDHFLKAKKRKVPVGTQILLWGVALGPKSGLVNFCDFYMEAHIEAKVFNLPPFHSQ